MAKDKKETGKVKARVLANCVYGKANEVVLVEASEVDGVMLDDTPAAVEYAESLAK